MDYFMILENILFLLTNQIISVMFKIKSGFKGERAVILPASVVESLQSDELCNSLYITDIGYYPKAESHYRVRTEKEATQYVLIYCLGGEGWYEVEGNRFKLNEHQFCILPKGKQHRYGSDKKGAWTILWIHFDGEKASFFADGLERPSRISPEKNSRIEERLKLFEELFGTLRNGYSKSNLHYSSSCLYHFLGSLKFLSSYRELSGADESKTDAIDDAIHFMRENIAKKLTLKEIADYIGYSASHFSALFQSKTDISPLNYFIQLKIQSSCHYLDFSDLKINQICMMFGFSDPFYFSRIFTKTMGVSPSDYRKLKKG